MLEPRSATSGAWPRSSSTIASTSSKAPGPELALRAAVAACVVGERGEPARRGKPARSRSGSPSPSPRRAGSPRPPRAPPREGTARRPARRASPSSGGAGGACFIIARDHGIRAADGDRSRTSTRSGSRLERARPARGGRLRRGRAGRASSARPRTSTPRTTSAPAPGPTWRRSARAPTASRCVYASKAFPCTAAFRLMAEEGLSLRRGLRRRAAPRARGRLRPGADLHARQQQDRGGARLRARARRRATSWSTRSTRSSGSSGSRPRPAGAAPRDARASSPTTHAYIQTGQEDSKFGFGLAEVAARRSSAAGARASTLAGLHAHIGSQVFELEASSGSPRCSAGSATGRC